MKKSLDDYRTEFGETAKQANDIARNLGLGAIAIVWIFKNPEGAAPLLPKALVLPLLLAVIGLGVDLLHYVSKAVVLYAFYREKEDLVDAQALPSAYAEDAHAPGFLEWMTWTFFTVKISLIVAAYISLGVFLQAKV